MEFDEDYRPYGNIACSMILMFRAVSKKEECFLICTIYVSAIWGSWGVQLGSGFIKFSWAGLFHSRFRVGVG